MNIKWLLKRIAQSIIAACLPFVAVVLVIALMAFLFTAPKSVSVFVIVLILFAYGWFVTMDW